MLIAATEHGICAVSFADQDASLEAFLHSEYPAARIQRSDAALEQWIKPLVNHLQGTQTRLALPLDLQATAFQLCVWEELRKIPCMAQLPANLPRFQVFESLDAWHGPVLSLDVWPVL